MRIVQNIFELTWQIPVKYFDRSYNNLWYYEILCDTVRSILCDTVRSILCVTVRSILCDTVRSILCDTVRSILCDTVRSILCDTARSILCDAMRYSVIFCEILCDTDRRQRCERLGRRIAEPWWETTWPPAWWPSCWRKHSTHPDGRTRCSRGAPRARRRSATHKPRPDASSTDLQNTDPKNSIHLRIYNILHLQYTGSTICRSIIISAYNVDLQDTD